MDEPPPPNKKQSKQHAAAAGERSPVANHAAEDAYDGTTVLPGFAGLPSGVIQNILDIQKSHKDRASLRLTSKSMRNEVEIFCKEALARLKKKHRVDDTFAERIGDQTDLETTRLKPVILPFFYLLWKAMKTYLYKLESPERITGDEAECFNLQLSATGDCIAITALGGDLTCENRLWDLESRQLLRVIGDGEPLNEFLVGDSVVYCFSDKIELWS